MRAVFPIRLAIVEKAKICRAAVLRKLSPSAYVRWAALEQADRDLASQAESEPEDERETRFSRGKLGAGVRSPSRKRLPPVDEDEPEESHQPAEWMRERGRQGLPDGATFEEWKSGGMPLGGDIRE